MIYRRAVAGFNLRILMLPGKRFGSCTPDSGAWSCFRTARDKTNKRDVIFLSGGLENCVRLKIESSTKVNRSCVAEIS